jgi:hypothetical protein
MIFEKFKICYFKDTIVEKKTSPKTISHQAIFPKSVYGCYRSNGVNFLQEYILEKTSPPSRWKQKALLMGSLSAF